MAAYLEIEARSELQHDLVGGYIHAIARASPRHDELCFQLRRGIREGLLGRGCYVASRDPRVAARPTRLRDRRRGSGRRTRRARAP